MEDLLDLATETNAEEPEIPESTDEAEPEQSETEGDKPEGDKTPVTSLFQPDGRKFDPQVTAALNKIKGENPELGKLLMRAVSRVGELDREFPGGLSEARELREKIEALGGIEGIEGKLEGLQELDGLAQAFMNADPAFVDDLIESSPEAFAALAPIVLQKFSEKSPEGFGAYVGRIVYSDMQANGLPLLMMRLDDLLGDNARAKETLAQINAYFGGFKTLAEKPLPEAKGKPAAPRKDDDLSKREESLRAREWQQERDSAQKSIVNTEYKRALAGRNPSGEEKGQILELFLSRSKAAADRQFPGWQEKAQKYIASNDKAGYLRYMKSIYQRVVPDAIASAVNSTMRGKRAAAPKQETRQVQTQTRTEPGFKPLAKEPSTWDIDYSRTTQKMLADNRAFLKNGDKVSWK